jgi:IS30 family transposase
MTYTHLTQEERYQIHSLRRQGVHLSQIAAELGRSTSTISRELRRNASARGYQPALAQDKATARQTQRRNARQFDAAQWQLVELYLRLSLSPQQVSDRLALEDRLSISTEAIYQYAYANKAKGGDLVGYLRCQKLRRKRYASGRERRGVLKNRVGIEASPRSGG